MGRPQKWVLTADLTCMSKYQLREWQRSMFSSISCFCSIYSLKKSLIPEISPGGPQREDGAGRKKTSWKLILNFWAKISWKICDALLCIFFEKILGQTWNRKFPIVPGDQKDYTVSRRPAPAPTPRLRQDQAARQHLNLRCLTRVGRTGNQEWSISMLTTAEMTCYELGFGTNLMTPPSINSAISSSHPSAAQPPTAFARCAPTFSSTVAPTNTQALFTAPTAAMMSSSTLKTCDFLYLMWLLIFALSPSQHLLQKRGERGKEGRSKRDCANSAPNLSPAARLLIDCVEVSSKCSIKYSLPFAFGLVTALLVCVVHP